MLKKPKKGIKKIEGKLQTPNQMKLVKQIKYLKFLYEAFKEAHYRWAVRIYY